MAGAYDYMVDGSCFKYVDELCGTVFNDVSSIAHVFIPLQSTMTGPAITYRRDESGCIRDSKGHRCVFIPYEATRFHEKYVTDGNGDTWHTTTGERCIFFSILNATTPTGITFQRNNVTLQIAGSDGFPFVYNVDPNTNRIKHALNHWITVFAPFDPMATPQWNRDPMVLYIPKSCTSASLHPYGKRERDEQDPHPKRRRKWDTDPALQGMEWQD